MFFRRKREQKTTQITWRTPGTSYFKISGMALDAEHTLIAGSTGCGKSTFIRSILQAFLSRYSPADAELVLIDPKVTDLWRYEKLPHVRNYVTDKTEAVEVLEQIAAEIPARQRAARAMDEDEYTGKALFVLIDELNPLMNDPENGARARRAIENIVTLGRAAKVHAIMATQNPNRKTIPGNIADNCTMRFGLKCKTRYQSSAIVGMGGCELLPKHGVTLADLNGELDKYAIPFVTMDDMKPLLSYWTSDKCKTVH